MSKTESKLTIAVDIDDVLAANATGFAEYSNRKWGTNLTPDDYTEHWAELWKVDFEEVERRRQQIVRDRLFTKHRFFSEAKPVLEALSQDFNLIIISSRGKSIQADTIEWLKKEYGDIFSGIHFAGIWDQDLHVLERLKLTKAEICRQLGADYLIDDQPKHCLAAAEAGITALLFGDYAWARDVPEQTNLIKVKTWPEVLAYFQNDKS
jgi:uncharacterized HAD superfamily protein